MADPDDFSDSELGGDYEEPGESLGGDQDEQHAQQVNGKIDSLKMKVKELEAELKKEKKLHEKTKESLANAVEKPRDALREESASALIIQELASTCTKLSLDISSYCSDSSNMAEEEIVAALRAIATAATNTAAASSSSSTKGSRPGTITMASSSGTKKNDGSHESMKKRIEDLEDELRLAMGAAEDIKALKAKLLQMIDRIRSEKDSRDKLNFELKTTRKKLAILTDHIEKLMGHLKHEAAAKIRALETLREQEKVTLHANQKALKLHRKCSAKDRFILELREGGKILEDQLRLMDEKYLELRTKLDYARDSSEKRIKKAEKAASDLRVKWTLAGNMGSLDALPVPNQSQYGGPVGMGGADTGSIGSFDQDGYTNAGQSYYTTDSRSTRNTSKGGSKKPRSAPKPKVFESEEEKEVEVERLLEKMRVKNGGGANWTEEKARTLLVTR